MTRQLVTCGLLVAALSPLGAAVVNGPGHAIPAYTFTRIADTTDFPGGIEPAVALNDAGQVAFVASPRDGLTAVIVGSGTALTTFADTSRIFSFFGLPGINGLGQATYFGNKDSHSGFYSGFDGSTTIVENRGAVHGFPGDIFSSPSGSFSVVEVTLSLPRQAQAIVAGNGGRPIRIADTSGMFQRLDSNPRVNASGRVVFRGVRGDGSQAIFVGQGGALTVIADTSSGPFVAFNDSPAINDRSEVLFEGTMTSPDGGQINGLFLASHGKTRALLDSTGAFLEFGVAPAINARGRIAFQGTTRDNGTGIFTGGDPAADRVIAVDDPLDGSTVSSFEVLSFNSGLNRAGQIAFMVHLADGRTGVYRADPLRNGEDDSEPR